MKRNLVSVIIPVYNEEKDVGECLKSLNGQSYRNIEIIIVDDGSLDKTREVVKSYNVKLINGEHKGPGYSRNLGAKIAKGNILIFIDADMTFNRDYIKKMIEPILSKKDTIGTTHEQEIVKNIDNIWSRCWGSIRVSKKNSKDVTIFRAIRKDKFLQLGGFDPIYGYADDQTLWFKYKIKPEVAPNTICYHKNPENLNGVYKQSRWIGASINNTEIPVIKYFIPMIMLVLFWIFIPAISIKKCYKNKEFIIFPWMLIFMIIRYFGTMEGIIRKVYLNKNFR